MHAYGQEAMDGQPARVYVDGLHIVDLEGKKARMSVQKAQKLQQQLGVAIGEALGQTSILPRSKYQTGEMEKR